MPSLQFSADYKRHLPTYLQINDFTDGSVEAVRKYLVQRESEKQLTKGASTAWSLRNELLANDNLVESFLTIHLGNLTQDPRWDGVDGSEWEDIREDITGLGDSADDLVRDLYWYFLQHGFVGVLVESPAQIARTELEAQAAGERAFVVLYQATDIYQLRYFTDQSPLRGEIAELIVRAEPFTNGDKKHERVRRYWLDPEVGVYQSQFLHADKDGLLSDKISGTMPYPKDFEKMDWIEEDEAQMGSLDRIPFVPLGSIDEGPEESVVRHNVALNKEHLNKKSGLDQILHYQGFQKYLFKAVEKEEVSAFAANIAAVASDPNAAVDVIEPANPDSLEGELRRIERKAQRLALLEHHQHNDDTRQVQSAESKKLDRLTLENYYVRVVEVTETAVREMFRFLSEFESRNPDLVQIELGKDFNLRDFEMEMQEDSLIWNWSAEMGQAGLDVRKQIYKRRVAEMAVVSNDEASEDQVKRELLESIDESQPQTQGERLADRLRARRDNLRVA